MWSEIGRDIATKDSFELTEFHEGRSEQPDLAADPRTEELAEAVLQHVVRLNHEGRGAEVRMQFDPAHASFIPELEKGGRGLTSCAIIDADEFIVRQGTTYQESTIWHIKGDEIQPLDGIANLLCREIGNSF